MALTWEQLTENAARRAQSSVLPPALQVANSRLPTWFSSREIGNIRLSGDEIRSQIDLLQSIRGEQDYQVEISYPDSYSGIDGLAASGIVIAHCDYGDVFIRDVLCFPSVEQLSVNAFTVYTQDASCLTTNFTLPRLYLSGSALRFSVAVQALNEAIDDRISKLRDIALFLSAILAALLRSLFIHDVIRTCLLRECPWHLVHGTHPPETSHAQNFIKASGGFATA